MLLFNEKKERLSKMLLFNEKKERLSKTRAARKIFKDYLK